MKEGNGMADSMGTARTAFVRICADEAEAAAIRARAEGYGSTVSELLRRVALMPVRMPERYRIAGIEEMDAAGSDMGRAIRGEAGRRRAEIPMHARRLRDRIMALRLERTCEPLPQGLFSWQGNKGSRDGPKKEFGFTFRCTPNEEERMLAFAGACRMPLSAFVRMRALGKPPQPAEQPVEGMAAARRCLGLLRHAAMQLPAWDAAIMQMRAEALEHLWKLREEAS